MKKIFVIAFVLFTMPVAAQQAPDPAFLQKALNSIRTQRNQALDEQAVSEARISMLNDELVKARARINELESQAQKKPPIEAPKD